MCHELMVRTSCSVKPSQTFSLPKFVFSKIPLLQYDPYYFILVAHLINLTLVFTFDSFSPVTPAKVFHLINKSSSKSSPLNFISSSQIKSCFSVFSELVAHLANLLISEGIFLPSSNYPRSLHFLKNMDLTKTLLVISGLSPT